MREYQNRRKVLPIALAWLCSGCFLTTNFAGLQPPSFSRDRTQPRLLKHRLHAVVDDTGKKLKAKVTTLIEVGATFSLEGETTQGWLSLGEVKPGTHTKSMFETGLKVGDELYVYLKTRKRDSIRITLAEDHPMFSKRRLTDLTVGEELEGEIVGVSKSAVFVEVGCTQQGFLPKANLLDNFGKNETLKNAFSNGQKLKVKVSEIEDSKLTLTQI
eukprot:TRINITY_DN15203_c0_g1_i2.p1 TRINITY_DN15203_c0_g1~~TRINITY_DN15203_c0_g1_i2.p1  ORF type:complete len:215 (+),score=28.38 TRINITY_DN15203_c0_g1_i2:66-710(+)